MTDLIRLLEFLRDVGSSCQMMAFLLAIILLLMVCLHHG
jgi:hypothetical protein